VLAGLEHDSPEKEATRLGQDSAIHMTYNEIMEQVEKDRIPTELGGDFPLNSQLKQMVVDPYMTVGEILENFMGRKGAAADPRYNYVRDQFWLQNQQMIIQKAQMAMQQQMMQQQQQAQAQQAALQQQQGGQPGEGQPGQEDQSQGQPQEAQAAPPNATGPEAAQKTEQWMAQNYMALEKGIKNNHSELSKMILARHKEVVNAQMEQFKADSKKAIEQMADIVGLKDDHEH
jgi:hypothetical protein